MAYIYQFHHDLFRLWESDQEVYRRIVDWVRGYGPATQTPEDRQTELPIFKILRRLQRTVLVQPDEKAPTQTFHLDSAFPDPAEGSVFWIQTLVHEMGDVDPSDFQRYMHGDDQFPEEVSNNP